MHTDPIIEAFDHRLRQDPDAPMVVSRRRESSATEIDALARAAGELLAGLDVGPGTSVGLAAPNGPGFVAGLLAIRRAGAAVLLFDARTPEAEKQRIVSTLGAGALLDCRRAWPGEDDFSLQGAGGGRPAKGLDPKIAVIKLTSGSTGMPRGILTPSAVLLADDAALTSTMGLGDEERILAAIPMSHSYGLSSVVLPAFTRRAVLIVPEGINPLDPMIAARERRATFLPTVPAYLQALVKMASPPRAPASLRLVVTAGAPLKPDTARRFREVYSLPVHVFYGASESGGITFDRTGTAGERGSLGTPVDGVNVTLEPGGAVTVASPAVAAGYHPDGDTSLESGRFRTRDLGVFRDGELHLEGRLDDLINIRGKKVNPREVEAVLGRLDGVDEAVALGADVDDSDDRIVRAIIACRPGALSRDTVHAWCRRHLVGHKVPRSIVLVEQLPRTARGKLDRAALLELRASDHG